MGILNKLYIILKKRWVIVLLSIIIIYLFFIFLPLIPLIISGLIFIAIVLFRSRKKKKLIIEQSITSNNLAAIKYLYKKLFKNIELFKTNIRNQKMNDEKYLLISDLKELTSQGNFCLSDKKCNIFLIDMTLKILDLIKFIYKKRTIQSKYLIYTIINLLDIIQNIFKYNLNIDIIIDHQHHETADKNIILIDFTVNTKDRKNMPLKDFIKYIEKIHTKWTYHEHKESDIIDRALFMLNL